MEGSGLPIGLGDEYEQEAIQLEAGDRVYLYSDGVTEASDRRGEFYGFHNLRRRLEMDAHLDVDDGVRSLVADVEQWRGGAPPSDDISVLAVQLVDPSS